MSPVKPDTPQEAPSWLGVMVMVNMSWITQTSGGSCSMALSGKTQFNWVIQQSRDILVAPTGIQHFFCFSLQPSHRLTENTELVVFAFILPLHLTMNNKLLFMSTNTEPLSDKMSIFFSI